ncbi:uroporphyrinogen-III synthase [Tomitella biformata]|uniref:uroporphyrinogen-III synthase n=1 Tax=Tomitella biformata TaxID=630403 RepID=UPI0004659E0E|nr:uroporphyrinogen-III synthase [Tomitella biformata]
MRELAGFTIGVTAARRAEEFANLLVRRGADVVCAPAIRVIDLEDDAELAAATHDVIGHPPRIVVATTGIGFRGWVEAAEGQGLGEGLRAALAGTRLLARGPKAVGAIRAAGLREEWSPVSESSAEVLERLLGQGVRGMRIAVQLHGAATEWEPATDICAALRRAGADVVAVPVYRWVPPADPTRLDHMIGLVSTGALDALTFTSAPAVASFLGRAQATGMLEPVLAALRGPVLAACVGAITAAPLTSLGVPAAVPERSRLGALARLLAEELPARSGVIHAGGSELRLRAGGVLLDGQACQLSPASLSLLTVLAAQPGRVVSRPELQAALATTGSHAVEAAVARLRGSLEAPGVVQTVVKRGYRLAVETT